MKRHGVFGNQAMGQLPSGIFGQRTPVAGLGATGGIFSGPTALGTALGSTDAAATRDKCYADCEFAWASAPDGDYLTNICQMQCDQAYAADPSNSTPAPTPVTPTPGPGGGYTPPTPLVTSTPPAPGPGGGGGGGAGTGGQQGVLDGAVTFLSGKFMGLPVGVWGVGLIVVVAAGIAVIRERG
jgi:hypothetical protein